MYARSTQNAKKREENNTTDAKKAKKLPVTDDYPSLQYKWWIKELGLQQAEKLIIENGEKQSDIHMTAVERHFNKQFPDISNMLLTVCFQRLHQVCRTSGRHIQIHFSHSHWVVSHLYENTISLYDSLNPSTVSADVCTATSPVLKGNGYCKHQRHSCPPTA